MTQKILANFRCSVVTACVFDTDQGFQTFFEWGKGPPQFLWAGSRLALVKITGSAIPGVLNYYVIFV
jgi:hypothetical protein